MRWPFPPVAVVVCLGSLPTSALAEDARAEAETLFRAGLRARDQGDCHGAIRHFRQSHELVAGKGKLLNIALCEEKLGLVATARAHFEELLPESPTSRAASERLAPDDERVAIARQHVASLTPRVPRLCVTRAPGAPPSTVVTLDGAPIAAGASCTPIPLDPGPHVVLASAPDHAKRRYDLVLEEGKTRELSVAPEPSRSSPTPPSGQDSTERPSGARRTAGFVVGGVGLAGLAAGGVLGALTFVKHADGEKCARDPACSASTDFDALNSSGKTMGIASTIALVAGAVGVGVGTYLVFTGGSGSAVRVGWLGGPGASVGAQGRF